jgi:hypothetical protein
MAITKWIHYAGHRMDPIRRSWNGSYTPIGDKDDGTAIFDAAIIVTDRNVLDSQLQDAVQQLDHQKGLIAAIDREKSSKSKSQQLTDALNKGVPIIVVTIQTFPYCH